MKSSFDIFGIWLINVDIFWLKKFFQKVKNWTKAVTSKPCVTLFSKRSQLKATYSLSWNTFLKL